VGQIEIYEFLKRMRQTGDDRFFTYEQIFKGAKDMDTTENRIGCRRQVNQLCNYGYLELKMTGKIMDWQRTFRLKKRYLNT